MASRQMNKLSADMSLHEVKDLIQLKYSREQASFIADNLDAMLKKTWEVAPVRELGHSYALDPPSGVRQLQRPERSKEKWMEKHWEEACYYSRWDKAHGFGSKLPFCWLARYQVMLRETNGDERWGEIDLLGSTEKFLPVVIELKSKTSEYLLRAIAEAAAYGVAVEKAWNVENSQFRIDWKNRFDLPTVQNSITTCPLVILAPTEYWAVCLSQDRKPIRFKTPFDAREPIRIFMDRLRERGFSVSLVEICHEDKSDADGLPVIIRAKIREMR
jgi:Holliday junction resolvase-like predicted endonuclease